MTRVLTTRFGSTDLTILIGDLTQETTDAIVNAANSSLAGGGGVDGAIHRAGGSTIYEECASYVKENGPLPPGAAMWTHGGDLAARYVIHTVGPIYKNEEASARILTSSYEESLKAAEELSLRSVSFPAISTGAYGYPLQPAARVSLEAIASRLKSGSSLRLVRIVCFGKPTFTAFSSELKALT